MKKITLAAHIFSAALLLVFTAALKPAFAAGAVEMQVEHMLMQAIDEYNAVSESGEIANWTKYFTDNVNRRSPLSEQTGKKDVGEYYAWEFKNFQAKMDPKKVLVSGRAGVVVFMWEGKHKPSDTPLKVEMVGIFEMASSGRFDKVTYFYDTAKVGKLLNDSMAAAK